MEQVKILRQLKLFFIKKGAINNKTIPDLVKVLENNLTGLKKVKHDDNTYNIDVAFCDSEGVNKVIITKKFIEVKIQQNFWNKLHIWLGTNYSSKNHFEAVTNIKHILKFALKHYLNIDADVSHISPKLEYKAVYVRGLGEL